jgi:hypothetical protein
MRCFSVKGSISAIEINMSAASAALAESQSGEPTSRNLTSSNSVRVFLARQFFGRLSTRQPALSRFASRSLDCLASQIVRDHGSLPLSPLNAR